MADFEGGDEWFVTDGVVAHGPVAFDQLAVDFARGRFKTGAFVRHVSWSIWERFDQLGRMSNADRHEKVRHLATVSRTAERRASDPSSIPPPPLDAPRDEPPASRETPPPISSGRPSAVNPVGVLARAETLDAAMHLALSTAVTAARADAGLIHRYRRDLDVFVTSHAMGDGAERQLGNRLAEDDPSVEAARAGRTLLVEAIPGRAGRHVAGRFVPVLGEVSGAAMVPISSFGTLHGMVEIARHGSSFFAREVARVEDVIEALTARAVVAGWVP